jgi:glycosyltransferase involved in cell wall biosynthesis
MKILHVITGLHDGGAEGTLFKLCKYDTLNSHFVVSLMAGGKYESKLNAINIPTYSLNLYAPLGILKCLYIYKKILDEVSPDVIQTWLYHADFFGGVCSLIFGYRNIFWNIRNCNTSKKALKFSTRVIVFINSIISNFIPRRIISVSQKATLHHTKIGFKANKFKNIPNGYEFNKSIKLSADLVELKKQSNFLIGMVARYDPQKDHENLLKSLVILKKNKIQFKCLLVGTGMDYKNVKLVNVIHQLNLIDSVKLLGRRDDISGVMQVLDLHVLSSLGEAFPNVLVEAMSNKTVCVSTDVGDASLIIDGNGWIVDSECSIKLANAILIAHDLFMNNKGYWELLRLNAQKSVVERFSIQNMINSYIEIWNE